MSAIQRVSGMAESSLAPAMWSMMIRIFGNAVARATTWALGFFSFGGLPRLMMSRVMPRFCTSARLAAWIGSAGSIAALHRYTRRPAIMAALSMGGLSAVMPLVLRSRLVMKSFELMSSWAV